VSHPLAVFTPLIGHWSHQYVRTHMHALLPGRTAVLGICALEPHPLRWSVDAPELVVEPPIRVSEYLDDPILPKTATLPERHLARFQHRAHLARIRAFLDEYGVRVILAQWLDAGLLLLPVARELGIPFVCQAHGTDITAGLVDERLRAAYRAYDETGGVISPSEFGRQQLVALGLRPEKVHVVRHAVSFPPAAAARPEAPVRCLAVGRMAPMKQPLLMVEAFARALAGGLDLHLDYVGDGVLHTAVRERVSCLGIAGRVTLHGPLRNAQMLSVMQRCHLLLHPSGVVAGEPRYDTCPVAVAEAMACGLPVVATRHGGIPEEVVEGESGLLVDEQDAEGLADAIARLARDRALRDAMGAAARERARTLFSLPVVRRQMLRLLGLSEQ
jgi:glycosyltransferase involved in cell wall biosynthesis